jgi:hypothetical protein
MVIQPHLVKSVALVNTHPRLPFFLARNTSALKAQLTTTQMPPPHANHVVLALISPLALSVVVMTSCVLQAPQTKMMMRQLRVKCVQSVHSSLRGHLKHALCLNALLEPMITMIILQPIVLRVIRTHSSLLLAKPLASTLALVLLVKVSQRHPQPFLTDYVLSANKVCRTRLLTIRGLVQ